MFMFRRIFRILALSLVAAALGLGCSAKKVGEEAPPEIEIVEFSVSQTEVDAGDEVLVSWKVRNASFVDLYANEENISSGDEVEGELSHQVNGRTIFRLEAHGAGGSINRNLEVKISSPGLPVVLAFSAQPAETMAGDTIALSWETEGATSVRISDGVDELSSDEGPLPTSGSLEVVVEEDTSFVLVASNEEGEREASVSVLTHADPLVDFSASADAIDPGQGTILSWTVAWATEARVHGPEGVIWESKEELSGSIEVFPLVDTEYRLEAKSLRGSATKTLAIAVAPLPPLDITEFDVFPRHAAPGETVTISWLVNGASALALRWNGEVIHEEEEAEHSNTLEWLVEEEGTVRLTVKNLLGEEVWEEIEVSVGDPEILSFVAPDSPFRDGGPLIFSWETRGGVHLSLELDGESLYETIPREGEDFEYLPEKMGELHFALVLTNGLGQEVRAEKTIHVTDGPLVESLSLSRSTICDTDSTTLSWVVSQGVDGVLPVVSVEVGGTAIDVGDQDPLEGSVEIGGLLAGNHTIRLTASAHERHPHEDTIDLRVFDEVFVAGLDVSPPTPSLGDDVTISWDVVCADEVQVDGGDAPWLSGDPFDDITTTGTMVHFEDICGGTGFPEDDGCVDVVFPAGFTFPFFGETKSEIRVYTDGAAGFGKSYVGDPGFNSEIPSASSTWMNFAVFWMDLWGDFFNPDVDATSEIGLLTELRGAAPDRHMILQWRNLIEMDFAGMPYDEVYEFQLVLFESGRFEFRYGTMYNAGRPGVEEGSLAVIGFQTTARDRYHSITHRQAVAGGLSGRTFVFDMPLVDPDESVSFTLERPMDFTLTFRGPSGEEEVPLSIAP